MKGLLLKIWAWIKTNLAIVSAIAVAFILYMFFNPFSMIDNYIEKKLEVAKTPVEFYNKMDSVVQENFKLDSILQVYNKQIGQYQEKIKQSNRTLRRLYKEIEELNEEALTYEGIRNYIDSLELTPLQLHEYWLNKYNIKD